ncbi:MAG TPA: ribonuclease HI family protein [Rhodocyclaceae bacterium]|nr:ribonuclease HI family protein [Rhodocyclaceae bacterium]
MLRQNLIEANDSPCWQASFDGSALPNPGRIGIGAVLVAPDGQRFEHSQRTDYVGCNNEAELLALCTILELALAHGAARIVVIGDSDIAVGYAKGIGASRVARLQPLTLRAQTLLRRFAYCELKWVPRHRNTDADRLARQALNLPIEHTEVSRRHRKKR